MSSSGRLFDKYPLISIDKLVAFVHTSIFKDVENDGVMIQIDQIVGDVTSIKISTNGHNKMVWTPIKTITVDGTESKTFTLATHNNIKVEVIGNTATIIQIAIKRTGAMDPAEHNHTADELKTIELLGLGTDNLLTDESEYNLITMNNGELVFSPTEG